MPLIEWDSSFNLNIPQIDKQHEKLIQIINKLADAVHNENNYNTILYTIKHLIDYSKYHLMTEEFYFNISDYPEKDYHTDEHNDFLLKLQNYTERIERDDLIQATEVLDYLMTLFMDHIIGTDKKFGIFYHSHKSIKAVSTL